jgi:hypothetical protein
MIEQRRQARKFFDFACDGIGAAGVEDAMAVALQNFGAIRDYNLLIT